MKNILILHGWGSSKKKWQKVKEILSGHGLKVVIPDFPGFGENPSSSQPWSVDDYVEWVRIFCEKENLSQFFLLGHSFGGRIAIKFAVKYPEKISGLILCGAPAIKDELEIKYLLAKALAKFFPKLSFLPFYQFFRKIFYKYFLRKTDYLKLEGIMKETYKKVIAEDLVLYLPQIKTKTLILWGKKDNFVSVKLAFLIEDKIPNSKLMIFPKVGHNLHSEAPEKLSETLLKFLENKL
ncbi:alpha/beta fold hydrolase [Patescibacteria group bacterium]